jgi:allantoinase
VWTGAVQRGFALEDVARWMAAAPAALAGLDAQAGVLEAGREANFVVFDPEAEFAVTADKLHFRHRVSPYVGETLRGVVQATYLRGEPVYRAGDFVARARGHELKLC